MRYFTRYFHDQIIPYHLLDFFESYEEADKYNDEFYWKLYEQRKKELVEEEFMPLESVESYLHSAFYVSSASTLISRISTDIVSLIADTRIFFLYGVSCEVYERMSINQERQALAVNKVYEEYEKHKRSDLEKIPNHWHELYEIDWQEGSLVRLDMVGENIILGLGTDCGDRYEITLKQAKIIHQENDKIQSLLHYAEFFFIDGKLEINLLTHFNEVSIIAEDLHMRQTHRDGVLIEP